METVCAPKLVVSVTRVGRDRLAKSKDVKWSRIALVMVIASKGSVIVKLGGRVIFVRSRCLALTIVITGECACWVSVTADLVSVDHLVNLRCVQRIAVVMDSVSVPRNVPRVPLFNASANRASAATTARWPTARTTAPTRVSVTTALVSATTNLRATTAANTRTLVPTIAAATVCVTTFWGSASAKMSLLVRLVSSGCMELGVLWKILAVTSVMGTGFVSTQPWITLRGLAPLSSGTLRTVRNLPVRLSGVFVPRARLGRTANLSVRLDATEMEGA